MTLFKSGGRHSITHHQAPPSNSTVDVQQGAVILFEHLCRPQTAVDVRPLILTEVQQPARLLKQHHPSWENDSVNAANPHKSAIQHKALLNLRLTLGLRSPYFWHNEHCLSSSLDHPVSMSVFDGLPLLPAYQTTKK